MAISMKRHWNPYELSLRTVGVGIVLSFLFHVLVLFFAGEYRGGVPRAQSSHPDMEVSLIPSSKFLDAVQTLQQTSKMPPSDPHFSSDRDLRTDRETSPEAPTMLPHQGARGKAKAPQDSTVFSMSQKDLVAENQNEKDQASTGVGDDSLVSQGFKDHIEKGQELKLNARAFDYGSYILRMKEKLLQHWKPAHSLPAKMYDYTEIRVDIGVRLTSSGEIKDLKELSHSALPGFDEEALRTLKEASPFPNPPKSLIQEDGYVYMPWSFVLSLRNWGYQDVE